MRERLSRRDFFRGLGIASFAADIVYATRLTRPNYELTQEVRGQIENLAFDLSGKISVDEGLTAPFEANGNLVKPILNKEILAEIILYTSFFDQGIEGAEKTFSYLSPRQILIKEEKSFLFAGSIKYSFSYSDEMHPVIINLDKDLITEYRKQLPKPDLDMFLCHEFYHFVQFTRNPQWRQIDSNLRVISAAGCALYIVKRFFEGVVGNYREVVESRDKTYLSRRRVLAAACKGAMGGVVSSIDATAKAVLILYFLWPGELQAQFQGGAGSIQSPIRMGIEGMILRKLPKDIRGKLVDFQVIT